CDTNPIVVTLTETTTAGSCPSNYIITRTWRAIDRCGNLATASQTITVQDTTAPTFVQTIPANVTVQCNAIPAPATITATDACDTNPIVVTLTETTTAGSCPSNYIITRTWRAIDRCGNLATASQTITVQDTTAPTLVTPFTNTIAVNCSAIPEIPVLEFVDNCSASVEVIFNEEITTISASEYVIVRDWLVIDFCGNSELFTQTINVSANTNPIEIIPFEICTLDISVDLFTLLNSNIPLTGQWVDISNSGGLSGSTFNPTNLSVGNYIIHYLISGTNGCPSIYEINIAVNDDCVVLPACDIVIYNAVSPNNDNTNEFFFIDGLECYPDNTVEIYNRWGILVYETRAYNNVSNSFKGYSEGRTTIAKNELLPDGTYYYILKYKDAENNTFDKSGYLYLNK
ncbi:MAG: gliding motility-associated C-terminal domain-containing protein, partial [Flavobacterium sp.]|nr:gliding motility-associated C-terminal domain-containing protein [Flavobacterium sp.]